MPNIDHAKIEALSELYDKTGEDWVLSVSVILTEPTCPTAIVRPEGKNNLRWSAHAGTIEEAINTAVDLAYREMILGEIIQPETPITNSDDVRFRQT